MLQLGTTHRMEILRSTSVGLYLGLGDYEVLLPNKYVPENYEIGDDLEVFVYLDSLERIVATTIEPFIKVNEFAFLRVAAISEIGAFLDYGLEKDLFVPNKEQAIKMQIGESYVVYCFLDENTNRLMGLSRVNKYLSNTDLTVERFEEVDLLISHFSDIGVNAIINNKHRGVFYHNEIYEQLEVGQRIKGTIKLIRAENKIDLSLIPIGYKNIDPNATIILNHLNQNQGVLMLHDGSDPELIHKTLKMSKKNFKKALGSLYKQKKVVLKEDRVELAK
ncbi:MAG: GntR family transcriptional regulator [Saprospiraceae bacterium]|nr:GntR family transcriptional regulator [Saprospiraceae bacterium]